MYRNDVPQKRLVIVPLIPCLAMDGDLYWRCERIRLNLGPNAIRSSDPRRRATQTQWFDRACSESCQNSSLGNAGGRGVLICTHRIRNGEPVKKIMIMKTLPLNFYGGDHFSVSRTEIVNVQVSCAVMIQIVLQLPNGRSPGNEVWMTCVSYMSPGRGLSGFARCMMTKGCGVRCDLYQRRVSSLRIIAPGIKSLHSLTPFPPPIFLNCLSNMTLREGSTVGSSSATVWW